jgi:hypothetical protein
MNCISAKYRMQNKNHIRSSNIRGNAVMHYPAMNNLAAPSNMNDSFYYIKLKPLGFMWSSMYPIASHHFSVGLGLISCKP